MSIKKNKRRTKRKIQNGRGLRKSARKAGQWLKNKFKTHKKRRFNNLLNSSQSNYRNYYDDYNDTGRMSGLRNRFSIAKLRRKYRKLYNKEVPVRFRDNKRWILKKIAEKEKKENKGEKKILRRGDRNMYETKIKLIANHIIDLQKLYMQVHAIYNILLNYDETEQGKKVGEFDVRLLAGGKGGYLINQFYNVIKNIIFDKDHMVYCTGITFNSNTGQHPYNGILNFLIGNFDENMLLRDISNLVVNIGCQLNKKYIYNGSGIILNNAEINTIGSISHMNKCQGSCSSMGENLNRQKYGLAFDDSDMIWTPREDNKNTKSFIDSSIYICMVLKNSIMKISKYYRMEELWVLSDINEYGKMFNSYTSPIPPYIMNLYARLFSLEKANEKMNKLNLILSNSIYANNFNTSNTFVKSIISEWINEITNAEYKKKIINIPKFYKVLKLENIEDMRCGYCKHNSIGIVINRNKT